MSRNIGFALDGGFYDRRGDTIDPTDAERVELAIAALTHGGRELPDVEEAERVEEERVAKLAAVLQDGGWEFPDLFVWDAARVLAAAGVEPPEGTEPADDRGHCTEGCHADAAGATS
jgi:hypothetical protein